MKLLNNKVAIITGAAAAHGIGRATAIKLAEAGAHVVITDIEKEWLIEGKKRQSYQLLSQTAADIEAAGGRALAMLADVTNAGDIQRCVESALSHFEHIDILVNNAGSLAGSDYFLKTTAKQWQQSFQVNLMGPMLFSQAVIPIMQKTGGGSIINIGSTGSLGAEAGFGAYTAMKHGLIGLTKTIAAEFGVDNIRCNAVCPGYIATDMHQAANQRLAAENHLTLSEVKERRYASVALKRAGTPKEVAEAVVYLSSPQSAYTTGIALPIAGGVPFGI